MTTTQNTFQVRREAVITFHPSSGDWYCYISRAGRFVSSTVHQSQEAAERCAARKHATVVQVKESTL